MPIFNQFENTIFRHQMLKPGEKVLLGVSGGPDSLSLLYLFDRLRKSLGLKIYVAHLNHGLREEAAADSAFVQKTCQRLGVTFIGEKAGLNFRSAKGSLEERA
jgi:tRNA(Ile)-lysidine synthase